MTRPYKRWTPARDEDLAYCWDTGLTARECAMAMDTTEKAIKARIERLRAINRKAFPKRMARWNDKADAKLVRLWESGMTIQQCAAAMVDVIPVANDRNSAVKDRLMLVMGRTKKAYKREPPTKRQEDDA